ncbi:nucleoporin Nup186/Nup192/Nup205 [Roridomyces roridus]|uniref:Nucleoporin Nup186/Nup192/Nup205 n=1 Tax=Roridomyces roridus TaxID=1738132 RepID=A0AAD7FGZ1_9AGAR|nr:nucleoporin Nup186/Nup192/Nup205 [Roridomyces roridus]
MESIGRLRVVLLNAITRGIHNAEQELFDELIAHKSCLLKLFDVGPRNPQEQRELESGKSVINGKQAVVNADFARQAIFLSQQLECSERYVAGILHAVTAENPNVSPVDCIELSIAEFHQRRRHLADCLGYIFEAAEVATESTEKASTLSRLQRFASLDLIPPPGSQQGTEVTLAHRIVREIQNLGNAVAKADAARKGARTDTVAPSAQAGTVPSLGYDILNSRYESLKYERRSLATCLSIIARLGHLSPNEIKVIIDWLSTTPNQSMTFYLLASALAAFDPVDPSTPGGQVRAQMTTNSDMITYMTKKLAPSTEWKEPGLKATVLLKWTLFLTDARHRNPQLEHRSGFKTEELETQVWNAVQGDSFSYLALVVLQLRRKNGSAPAASFANTLTLSAEQQELREAPSEDFIPVVFSAFEILVRSLITHASSELRKIKQRQEDLVLASARTDRRAAPTRFQSEAERPAASPRSDIAMLYSFIGLLYSVLPPERALQFWGSTPHGGDSESIRYLQYTENTMGRLPAFLQWAVWSTQVHDVLMAMALYDMLAGLANGQMCSELAYNFMVRGTGEVIPGSSLPSSSAGGPAVSWSVVFSLLDSWAASSSNNVGARASQPAQTTFGNSGMSLGMSSFNHPPPPPPPSTVITIGPKEVLLAQSFLNLLSTVVAHSVAVRGAISSHGQYRAIPTLLALIPLGVPLELKGAIFNTLAAFCQPGASGQGLEICRAVWSLMERHEVINVRSASGFGGALPPVKGVEMELDEIEAAHRMYPSTIPFLRLLSTLIHTPKRIPLREHVIDAPSINTIPDNLGQSYRNGGIAPFVTFVIDNVFANIPNREYLQPSDRWETNDLCLCFIERALASFDLEGLVRGMDEAQLKGETLHSLLLHPGYDIMKRLLTSSPLQNSILTYVVEGLAGFEKGLAEEELYFGRTITRVLRIILRVLEIQDIFLDVLLPLLHESESNALLTGTLHPRTHFTKLDQALSYSPQYAPALAAYVSFPSHPELVLLSVKILSVLSCSTAFSSLYTLIQRSEESDRVMAGFIRILSSESGTGVQLAETVAERSTGAGAPDEDVGLDQPALQQAIRLEVLQLFIKNTESGRPYPNIAHFFLFGNTNNEQVVQDPHALGSHRTCVHVILELANIGVPRLDVQNESELDSDPLLVNLPGLAELLYRIIYQLCTHSRTSEFTMRYLRTREDFFARQLAAIPSQVPFTEDPNGITVQYPDGARVNTNVPALSSFLRLRSWIFDLAALDLHVLTSKGHFKGVAELLDILFGSNNKNVYDTFQEVGQSNLRIIEFVQSLAFDWADQINVQPCEVQYLSQLNLHSCVRKDTNGCEIIDRTALLALLIAARKLLNAQNGIVSSAQETQLTREVSYILESCAVENHRREVAHAKSIGYESWKRLLDMTLTKCFTRLPHDHRENVLFDLLHVLPTVLRSEDIQESSAVLLSEAVLSSVTKLREDRRHQILVQTASGDAEAGSLPAERLYAILRNVLECILDNNRVELVRGNLYAALINYVHLIAPSADAGEPKAPSLAVSLATSTNRDDFLFGESQALVPVGRTQSTGASLELGSLSLIKSVAERLVATISRDAIDGSEVWKTIAFMLLDSLTQLSGLEKQHVVLTALVRHGILTNFVRGIKESDLRLQSVLKPDPDDLNPLYVYEAKMSLFVRMAQTRLGAERLLEAQLIPILSQCDYLDARPEADQSFMDYDSFLPSAIQRYHQLFMPALQLVDGMLATLGTKHATVTNQALDFLSSHSATIVILLKNDTDQIPLAFVEEMHLLISLCTGVLPNVPKSELLSPHSGFGAIHAAVLALATQSLGSARWLTEVTPQTDAEILSASTLALGYRSETKFDTSKREMERMIRKSVIEYIGAASDFTEPEITPVLSPVTATPRHDHDRGMSSQSHFLATIPTVGDALDALQALCGDLSHTLSQIADLSAELAAKEHVGVENITELLPDADPAFLRGLEIGQKRALVCRALASERKTAQAAARTLLGTLEMLLLLLWRHLVYYADVGAKPVANPASALRFLAPPEPEAFREGVAQRLAPALMRLASLDLGAGGGESWLRASAGYVEIMGRRLRDSAGILDSDSEGMQG